MGAGVAQRRRRLGVGAGVAQVGAGVAFFAQVWAGVAQRKRRL